MYIGFGDARDNPCGRFDRVHRSSGLARVPAMPFLLEEATVNDMRARGCSSGRDYGQEGR
jgi:hypothetical protein